MCGIINEVHIEKAHTGRDGMLNNLKYIYENITRSHVEMYLGNCEICFSKNNKPKKGIVVHPIISNKLYSIAQVDLIDFQSQPDIQP